jgi:hypothetical protein
MPAELVTARHALQVLVRPPSGSVNPRNLVRTGLDATLVSASTTPGSALRLTSTDAPDPAGLDP